MLTLAGSRNLSSLDSFYDQNLSDCIDNLDKVARCNLRAVFGAFENIDALHHSPYAQPAWDTANKAYAASMAPNRSFNRRDAIGWSPALSATEEIVGALVRCSSRSCSRAGS